MSEKDKLELQSAKIRLLILKMLKKIGYGHIGGSLSIVELLSVLYSTYLNIDPKNPDSVNRDYVILSKGHSGPGLYATLANFGYFPEDLLYTLNEGNTNLPSHPDRNKTPGVDMTTGSLGQGTSVAAGIGYGFKLNRSKQKVVLIVGDGELNEGQCWEAFQFIAHHKLSNVKVIIDNNKKQLDGYTEEIINTFDLNEKMRSFGFYSQRVKGDDEVAILEALQKTDNIDNQAVSIILDTTKGQGIEYFENLYANHSVNFNDSEFEIIDKNIERLENYISFRGTGWK